MAEDKVAVSMLVKERHEIEIGKGFVSGWGRQAYFPVWRRSITEGRHRGCVDVIRFESYRSEPPGPRLRWTTESGHNIGIHRLVHDQGKWFVELLEENPIPPERLPEESLKESP